MLITHEHGDHYMGLDELFSYKRTRARGEFEPIGIHIDLPFKITVAYDDLPVQL